MIYNCSEVHAYRSRLHRQRGSIAVRLPERSDQSGSRRAAGKRVGCRLPVAGCRPETSATDNRITDNRSYGSVNVISEAPEATATDCLPSTEWLDGGAITTPPV